jgi:hypothetical protein
MINHTSQTSIINLKLVRFITSLNMAALSHSLRLPGQLVTATMLREAIKKDTCTFKRLDYILHPL